MFEVHPISGFVYDEHGVRQKNPAPAVANEFYGDKNRSIVCSDGQLAEEVVWSTFAPADCPTPSAVYHLDFDATFNGVSNLVAVWTDVAPALDMVGFFLPSDIPAALRIVCPSIRDSAPERFKVYYSNSPMEMDVSTILVMRGQALNVGRYFTHAVVSKLAILPNGSMADAHTLPPSAISAWAKTMARRAVEGYDFNMTIKPNFWHDFKAKRASANIRA